MTILLWSLGVVLVLVGVVGTLLPVLPGAALVFAGLLLAAWADGFAHVGGFTLVLLALLAILVYIVDFAAGAFGARHLGASSRAVWGAALGSLVGIFFGPAGILLGPFLGAVLGEYTVRRHLGKAARAGTGAWLGLVLAAAAKVALVFTMLGFFTAAFVL